MDEDHRRFGSVYRRTFNRRFIGGRNCQSGKCISILFPKRICYALQDVNTRIFSEWLPAIKDYEFAAGYCVEYYDDPSKYEKGTQNEKYYCEIWIPVKKK